METNLTTFAILSAVVVGIWRFSSGIIIKIFNLFKSVFVTTIHIHSTDIAYDYYLEVLQYHKSDIIKNYKFNVKSNLSYNEEESEGKWYNSIGLGFNIIWYKGKILFVNLQRQEGQQTYFEKIDLYISYIGSPDIAEELVEEAYKMSSGRGTTKIYIYNCGWSYLNTKTKRDIDSVFWNAGEKESLINDLQKFYHNKKAYIDLGMPYKRGYLLYGEPGTGKTSMVFSLAGLFDKNISIINLSTISDDNELLKAFSCVPNDSILLLEDIDLIFQKLQDKETKENEKNMITFSGVLNALDGITYKEGLVTFLTTNHIDRLDEAAIRNGRVDKKIEVNPLQEEAIRNMCKHYGADPDMVIKEHGEVINPSKLKNLLTQGI